jgi:hypothetical protein
MCLIQFLSATGKKKKLSSTVTIVLVAGTDACQNAYMNSTTTKTATSTVLNQKRVKTTATAMLLHNNSIKYVRHFSFKTKIFYLVVMKTVKHFLMALYHQIMIIIRSRIMKHH